MIKVLISDAEGEGDNIRQVVMCLLVVKNYELFLLSGIKDNHIKYSKHCNRFFLSENRGYGSKWLSEMLEIIDKQNIDIVLPTSVGGYQLAIDNLKLLQNSTRLILMPQKESYEIAAKKTISQNFVTRTILILQKLFL